MLHPRIYYLYKSHNSFLRARKTVENHFTEMVHMADITALLKGMWFVLKVTWPDTHTGNLQLFLRLPLPGWGEVTWLYITQDQKFIAFGYPINYLSTFDGWSFILCYDHHLSLGWVDLRVLTVSVKAGISQALGVFFFAPHILSHFVFVHGSML